MQKLKENYNTTKVDTEEFNTTEIPIQIKDITDGIQPHFYLKWFPDNKRYRVSISYRFLHRTWDLRVNIIRDLNRISNNNMEFIYKLFKKHCSKESKISFLDENNKLGFLHIIDSKNHAEFFLFERIFCGEKNRLLVFISDKYWSIEDYIDGSEAI